MSTADFLEQEQKELLSSLVEVARSVPRDQRQKFMFSTNDSGKSWVKHFALPNWKLDCYKGDADILISRSFLNPTYWNGALSGFDITPEGIRCYELLKRQNSEPLAAVEDSIKIQVLSFDFQGRYPQAATKWTQAESLLWVTDSEQQLTTVGHLCREAVQEFASSLVQNIRPAKVDNDPAHQIARLRAVLDHIKSGTSTTLVRFLNSLLEYWGALSDLIQRQEHDGQKEGAPLIWDDGRRIVFHTAIVFYEIDRALSLQASHKTK